MSRKRATRESKSTSIFRKFIVSAFVVLSFTAYALHQHALGADQAGAIPLPTPTQAIVANPQTIPTRGKVAQPSNTHVPTEPPPLPVATDVFVPTSVPPTDVPTDVPSPQPKNNGAYQDGSYTGDAVDVYYGLVQVQTVIQNGKIANVQFLQFPQDRRTSQQINSVAVPYLKQEAMQAQSANVDIISGATLTSEGFIQSLTSALATAKNGS